MVYIEFDNETNKKKTSLKMIIRPPDNRNDYKIMSDI